MPFSDWLSMCSNIVDDRYQHALEVANDALFHFVGRHAWIIPDDGHDRDVYLGKDIRRHAQDRDRADHENKHAITTNVYGLRNARATIHIPKSFCEDKSDPAFHTRRIRLTERTSNI